MKISAYKGRVIDPAKPVRVYRNLHRDAWSLEQGGLIVGHADEVILADVKFSVSEAGRQRVLREKRKNVHAKAIGYVSDSVSAGDWRVSYNPYRGPHFVIADSSLVIEAAPAARLAQDGKVYV